MTSNLGPISAFDCGGRRSAFRRSARMSRMCRRSSRTFSGVPWAMASGACVKRRCREPGTREAAAWACAELYRIPTHGGPRDQAEVFGLDTLPTLALMPGERQWLQRQLPDTFVVADAPFPGIALRVRLWVVNPEISTVADEIACELPVPMWIMGQPANLAIIRSLPRFSGGRGAGNR